ncbi:hypothetical protein F9K79_08655 [Ochrobactrum sp. Kaboul]|nr:hypothetical protein F9K79_08655 [Ochrobactrum sp. Kaboul]
MLQTETVRAPIWFIQIETRSGTVLQHPQSSYAKSALQLAKTIAYIMGNKRDELNPSDTIAH